MMGSQQFLDVFSWSFAVAVLYDIVYLFFFCRHREALGGFLLIVCVIALVSFGQDATQNPWRELGELLLGIFILGIAGCGVVGVAGYVAYRQLKQHDYKWSTTTRLLSHLIAFSIGVATVLLLPELLEKLLG